MSLRLRLGLIFIGMVLLTLLFTTALSWQELVAEPDDPEAGEENLHESMSWRLMEIVVRGTGPAVLLAFMSWWLTQRMLRPIEILTKATEKLEKGGYGEQIPLIKGSDELARLMKAFNSMSLQVAASFQRIREFTLHASHELKTPLTVLRSSLERRLPSTAIGSAERDEMASMLDEIQRLTSIVDALTLLSKADAQQLYFEHQPVDLKAIVTTAHEDTEALADGRELTVVLKRCDAVSVTGDRFRLRQLLLILADNAVKYNFPGGTVTLELEALPETAVITMTNTGRGVEATQQSRVFDRFYRGEEAQSLNIDGCGLGLSIAQWIAGAHGAALHFESNSQETRVTATFPRLE